MIRASEEGGSELLSGVEAGGGPEGGRFRRASESPVVDGSSVRGSGNDGGRDSGRGRGCGSGGGGLSAFASAFLAARAALHFAELARVMLCGVVLGEKAREVFLVHLAALVDLGDVQQHAVARAHFGRVDPDVPRAGLVDDDLGHRLGFLLASEFSQADAGNKGAGLAGQFGRRQSLQNRDGSGDALWSGSGCRNVLGVLGILAGGG